MAVPDPQQFIQPRQENNAEGVINLTPQSISAISKLDPDIKAAPVVNGVNTASSAVPLLNTGVNSSYAWGDQPMNITQGSQQSVPGSQLQYTQPTTGGSTSSGTTSGMQNFNNQITQANANYSNPTNVNQSTKTFGESDQFNIDPFMQPFPFQQQKDENQNFNQQFTGFLSGLETPEATRERFENRYGYQNLAEDYFRTGEAARGVMDQARALPENIGQRAAQSGTVMSQGQLDRIQNVEVKELMETYNNLATINAEQGARLSFVEQQMNEAAKLELAQQAKMISPWLQQYESQQIMQAREFTGYTFANQMELNRLLSNQASSLNWDQGEAERANRLALAEAEYKRTMDSLKYQNEMYLEGWGF